MMHKQSDIYAHYFKTLVNKDIRLTSDITPSYSLLKPLHFQHTKDLMQNAEFHVKVVFLMRDPVARIWSSMRMCMRNAERKNIDHPTVTKDLILDSFEPDAKSLPLDRRTDNLATIKILKAVFDLGQIHYEFYARLFSPLAISNLSNLLGIPSTDYDFDNRFNVSKPIDLPTNKVAFARKPYKSVYQDCHKKIPRNL